MSFLAAVATTDGNRVDEHFGRAAALKIYEISPDGASVLKEERKIPKIHLETKSGAGGETGCGCGGGHCGCGGLKTMDVSFLDPVVNAFSDCSYILAERIGPAIDKAFGQHGITTFSIGLPVTEALKKISVYENRLHHRG